MAQRDDAITLDEIAENIGRIRAFMAGLDQVAFEADDKSVYAVTRALEIISEAARRLSPELKARHPQIPWRNVEDAGNQYRHVYHRISVTTLWMTADRPMRDLQAVVEAERAS